MQPATTQTATPASVKAAFWLSLATIAVGLLHSWLNLVYVHQSNARQALIDAGADTETLRRATVAIAAGLLLVQLLIIFRMRAGKRWARTLLTLLLLMQLVSYWIVVARPAEQPNTAAETLDLVANSLSASFGVLTLVLLHSRGSRAWYRSH